MSNQIQFKRLIDPSASLPTAVAAGEPVAVLDAAGRVDLYIGDSAGTPILINPAPTPIGGVEFSYRWDDDISGAAPAVGGVKIDGNQGGTPSIAATLSIHRETLAGTDTDAFWPLVKAGDFLGLFEAGGGGGAGGEQFYWEVAGPATQVGDHWDVPGSVAFYGGDDIDDKRPTSVFWVQNPSNIATGDVVTDPGPSQNLIQPTADHPAMRFLRTTGQTSNVVGFYDELSNLAGGFRVEGTQAGGDLQLVFDAGTF